MTSFSPLKSVMKIFGYWKNKIIDDSKPLTQSEVDLGDLHGTYNEFCERMGIVDPDTLKLADKLDGYK